MIGASLGGLAGIIAEGKCAPGSFGSLTLVDVTPQMEPSGVARVVGFMAAHARDGFASVEEAAQVIADYLPHRPSRKASAGLRSEEHTYELQSLMRISYAVFCLKKKTNSRRIY